MNRIVPLILAVALFMENMDSTVIATALPAIANDLGVGPITLKLALTSYMVALAIFIPVSGWMADKFGAKQIFRAAMGFSSSAPSAAPCPVRWWNSSLPGFFRAWAGR